MKCKVLGREADKMLWLRGIFLPRTYREALTCSIRRLESPSYFLTCAALPMLLCQGPGVDDTRSGRYYRWDVHVDRPIHVSTAARKRRFTQYHDLQWMWESDSEVEDCNHYVRHSSAARTTLGNGAKLHCQCPMLLSLCRQRPAPPARDPASPTRATSC